MFERELYLILNIIKDNFVRKITKVTSKIYSEKR